MIITNLLLRDLKKNKGTIINISSITAEKTNPHGCAYGATKAGLTSFSHSLFEEARKYGVRVVNLEPDMTDTNLYRNADLQWMKMKLQEYSQMRLQTQCFMFGAKRRPCDDRYHHKATASQNCKKVKCLYFKKHQMPFERLTYSH